MPPGLLDLYQDRVRQGRVSPDADQARAVRNLQRLYDDLTRPVSHSFWQRFRRPDPVRGVYLYGGVGRGKSMLMDMFFSALPNTIPKRRVHFHAFMIEIHADLNQARLDDRAETALADIAKDIAENTRVLCFDEFHVTDVADAMILSRLFTFVLDRGVAVVATSNWEPDRLYEGGLQRDRFLPFIDLVKRRMDVVPLNGPTDYRLKSMTDTGVYLFPFGPDTSAKADRLFATLTDHAPVASETLHVKGRAVPVATIAHRVARMSFAELCEKPLGAEDYIALTGICDTLFLENVPKLSDEKRNEAKRLMTLVDTLYEAHTRLVVTADAPVTEIYTGARHSFEFQRTVSRLIEMQGEGYLANQPPLSSRSEAEGPAQEEIKR